MKKIAFLFPGQGSQKVGMGQDIYEASNPARQMFDLGEAITGLDLKRLCFQGPMDVLTRTVNLQPAVTAVNLAFLAFLDHSGMRPAVTAGHSLGEYSALCASGAVSAADAFRLVLERGRLMQREADRHPGAMSAIVGLPIETVDALVAEAAETGVVAVANHNTETQIVVTGASDPVSGVAERARAAGARAIPLRVSGAWHSELIRGSVPDFERLLGRVEFSAPQVPLLLNVTADFCSSPDGLRQIMAGQLCRPVRWYDLMRRLVAEEVDVFVEVGPGTVLTGLAKKTIPADYPCSLHSVNSLKSAEAFLEAMG